MVQGRIILNLPIGKICGFSRLAFSRVGSWRKTAAAAPASCGSGGAAGATFCLALAGKHPLSHALRRASSPERGSLPPQSASLRLQPAPPKGGALFVLTGRWQKAPPSGELDATGGSGLRGFPYIIGITPALVAHTDAASGARRVFHRQKVLRLCILHRKFDN